MRTGVIHNPLSHRNRAAAAPAVNGSLHASPETPRALAAALADMAEADIDLLVIDGGDGTVRDVLTQAFPAFQGRLPLLAVVPHGKTNVLARDLGVPATWSVEAAIDAARSTTRRATRPLLEVTRAGDAAPTLRGFVFGAGAYVGATRLATRAHRMGVIDSFAVGAALTGAVFSTVFGGPRGFGAGEPIGLSTDGTATLTANRFLVLASTLERFPLRLKPFGRPRLGLKLLDVDAPPRRLIAALAPIVFGREPGWLDRAGYRRSTPDRLSLGGASAFVLDGEIYPGGDLTVRRGPSVAFVTP